ncbi:zinc finger protein 135-like protein, partial [Lates japonicus]
MNRHRNQPEVDSGKPETKLRGTVSPPDVHRVIVVKEEHQEWSPSLDQEDPEPPHIKEEQEEVWSSQEGEQLQGLEEADITKFTFTPVPVKSEDDEEKPQSSELYQSFPLQTITHTAEKPGPGSEESDPDDDWMETREPQSEAGGEDCGGPEPDRNSGPDAHSQSETEDKSSESSGPESEDDDDSKTTRELQPGDNRLITVHMLRALVKQRLTAAAEEIFGLFERTIAEYEEELCRSKEENQRQRKLLDAVFNPQVQLHTA